jgi:hypothetical protein
MKLHEGEDFDVGFIRLSRVAVPAGWLYMKAARVGENNGWGVFVPDPGAQHVRAAELETGVFHDA